MDEIWDIREGAQKDGNYNNNINNGVFLENSERQASLPNQALHVITQN